MPRTPIARLRLIALLEGVSFLLLLGVAMPLKYLAGVPLAVKIVGWAHGILFIAFALSIAPAVTAAKWPAWRAGLVLLGGLVPFGPFFMDRRLKETERRLQGASRPAV